MTFQKGDRCTHIENLGRIYTIDEQVGEWVKLAGMPAGMRFLAAEFTKIPLKRRYTNNCPCGIASTACEYHDF